MIAHGAEHLLPKEVSLFLMKRLLSAMALLSIIAVIISTTI